MLRGNTTSKRKKKQKNIQIKYKNEVKTIKEWSEELGISYELLYARYRKGKTEDDLFKPKRSHSTSKKIETTKKPITISNFIANNPPAKRLHNIWTGMRSRCYYVSNKDYLVYGGKGIVVDEIWKKSFFAFYEWSIANGYQESLTLMRQDRKGNYEPKNCKWATMEEQLNTRRHLKFLEINGETKTIGTWSQETGVSQTAINNRLNKGLSGEDLLEFHGPKITYKGKTKSIGEWADVTGELYATLYSRWCRGKEGDELFRPVRNRRENLQVEINGEKRSIREWADRSGIKYATLLNRYNSGIVGIEFLSPTRRFKENTKKLNMSQVLRENPSVGKPYKTWKDMRRRCYLIKNKDYHYYGAKGITMSDEWKEDFWSFYNWSMKNGITETASLFRTNKKGNFEPANCMWLESKKNTI